MKTNSPSSPSVVYPQLREPDGPEVAPTVEVEVELELDDLLIPQEVERPSLVGSHISERYRVNQLIAEGGMGAVYRGEHVHMRKLVAIKVLRPGVAGSPDLVQRFEREAIAGAHIDHPNVACATDFGRLPGGAYFLVLEHVDGVTLRDRMKRGPIAPGEAAAIARQIAEALGACHAMDILHRDVKPRNLMIEARTGRVKLIDFGLAKLPVARQRSPVAHETEGEDGEGRGAITLNGVVFGTVAYIAPEAEFGMAELDHRADLYALGVILYEMLAGKHPFDAKALPELFACHKRVAPPSFAVRAPTRTIPAALEAITMRLLAKRPADRFQDAAAVVAALDAATARASVAPEAGGAIASESTFDPSTVARATSSIEATATRGRSPARGRAWLGAAMAAGAVLAAVTSTTLPRARATAEAARAAPFVVHASNAVVTRALAPPRGAAEEDGAAPRARFRAAADERAWGRAADALLTLASRDGAAPLDATDVTPAGNVALALAFTDDPKSGPLLDALARSFGPWGVDVLYDITSKHGGARGARRAHQLLGDAAVRARGSTPVRAALDLREAKCDSKEALFQHVADDGDERALVLLERLRGVKCQASRCCYVKNRRLTDAIGALKTRLAR